MRSYESALESLPSTPPSDLPSNLPHPTAPSHTVPTPHPNHITPPRRASNLPINLNIKLPINLPSSFYTRNLASPPLVSSSPKAEIDACNQNSYESDLAPLGQPNQISDDEGNPSTSHPSTVSHLAQ